MAIFTMDFVSFALGCVLFTRLLTCEQVTATPPHVVTFAPPRLYPAAEDITVAVGDTFDIRCEARKPIKWNYTLPDEQFYSPKINITEWVNRNSEYPHVSHLTVRGANFRDTGFYYCLFRGETDLTAVDHVAKIYVYVNDTDHLFADEREFEFLTVIHYQETVIPCRPTNPKVNMSLFMEDEPMLPSEENFMEYDPHLGFVITSAFFRLHAGSFVCKATFGRRTAEKHIILNLLADTDYVPRPHVNDSLARHVVEGDDFTLDCSVTIEMAVLVSVTWQLPNEETLESDRAVKSSPTQETLVLPGGEQKVIHCALTVKNAQLGDQGDYVCLVQDHASNRNSDKKFVRVFDSSAAHINLDVQGTSWLEVEAGKEVVQWVVKVDAHPPPELIWYRQEDWQELRSNNKYDITLTPDRQYTIFKIYNVLADDAGVYVLKGVARDEEAAVNLTLVVRDTPKVTVGGREKSFYMYKKTYTFNCTGEGYPTPTLRWKFNKCTSYMKCSKSSKILKKNAEKKIGEGQVWSSLSVRMRETGYYSCEACNMQGCSQTKFPVFIAGPNHTWKAGDAAS